MKEEKLILKKAKSSSCWIVLPEAEKCERVLNAGLKAVRKKLCNIILLGGFNLKQYESKRVKVINPKNFENKVEMTEALYNLRKDKGVTLKEAQKLILDVNYFAVMLLKMGYCDGVVSGAITSSKDVIKPALQIIKAEKGIKTVSSCFLMLDKTRSYVFADCGLVEKPTPEQLCDIAIASSKSCENFLFQKAKVGLLSYSTLGSATSDEINNVLMAKKLLKDKKVKFDFDGEFQVDSAINPSVALVKAPKSKIAGGCNTLVFPDLNSGNIGYKLYQSGSSCKAIGPVLQGLALPLNDLSRGATEKEILLSIAITILQNKNIKERN